MPPRPAIVIMLVILLVSALVMGGLLCHPVLSISVDQQLIGPEDEVFQLLHGKAPLESIQASVAASGKGVDEFFWLHGSLLSTAAVERRIDVAEWLLQEGADPNGVMPAAPPLVYAIYDEDLEMVKLLLEYGADPDREISPHSDRKGFTPRSIALDRNNDQIIELLRTGHLSGKEEQKTADD